MNFELKKIQLEEMLKERETRASLQRDFLSASGCSVVSLSMNIAGEIKTSPAIELIFKSGLQYFEEKITSVPVRKLVRMSPAGPHALLAYAVDPTVLKAIAVCIEEGIGAEEDDLAPGCSGRLFDFDVIGPEGVKLSRAIPRKCLVCGGPVSDCARNRAHGLAAITAAQNQLIISYASRLAGNMAYEAIRQEALLTPKPGLVDGRNNGAHKDMNLSMLLSSAQSLRAHLMNFYAIGANQTECMEALVEEGLMAENNMFSVTHGINTHKGVIFLFALVLAAYGFCSMEGGNWQQRISYLALQKRNLGEVHGTHGGGKALAEAESGYALAFQASEMLSSESVLRTLCFIMSALDDSNVLHRGGEAGLRFVKEKACGLLQMSAEELPAKLEALDDEMIARNLSPGGAADMLSLALFLKNVLEDQDENSKKL